MEQFLKKNLVVSMIAIFLLGGLSAWGVGKIWEHYQHEKTLSASLTLNSEELNLDDLFNRDFFKRSRDPFQEMDRIHREMMRSFEKFGLEEEHFGDWFRNNFGGGAPADFQVKEDNDFVYYEIRTGDALPKKLEVDVKDGQVTIRGEIEKKDEKSDSASHYSSTFMRSFPAPENVEAEKFHIEQDPQRIVIKFPKVKDRL